MTNTTTNTTVNLHSLIARLDDSQYANLVRYLETGCVQDEFKLVFSNQEQLVRATELMQLFVNGAGQLIPPSVPTEWKAAFEAFNSGEFIRRDAVEVLLKAGEDMDALDAFFTNRFKAKAAATPKVKPPKRAKGTKKSKFRKGLASVGSKLSGRA